MNRKQRRAPAKQGQTFGVSGTAASTKGVTDLLEAGIQSQQAGRLAEAEACYRRVLAVQPDHADALHLLGVVAHQARRSDLAVELIGRAIERNGRNPFCFSNLGVVLKDQGKLDGAISAYRQAIRFKPDCAEAYSKDHHAYGPSVSSANTFPPPCSLAPTQNILAVDGSTGPQPVMLTTIKSCRQCREGGHSNH